MAQETINVLYIADHPEQRAALTKQLSARGFAVEAVGTREQGLTALSDADRSFDVLLCDCHLQGGVTGLQVLQQAHALSADLPVILLTSHGSIALGVEAIKQGAFQFVTKPVEVDALAVHLRQGCEHRRIARRLRRSEATLDSLMQTVPDIVYSLDPQGNFLSVSPAGEQLLGYRTEDVLGTSVFALVHPDDREHVAGTMQRSIIDHDDSIQSAEFRMITASGEVRDFEVRRRIVFDNGKPLRNDGVARDITERKRLERSLLEKQTSLEEANAELRRNNAEMEELLAQISASREILQAILDASPAAILMVDAAGVITACNQAVAEIFGLSSCRALVGETELSFVERIAPCFADGHRFAAMVSELREVPRVGDFSAPDPHELFERMLQLDRPQQRFLSLFSFPVSGARGNLGRVWIYSDITRLKAADEQLHMIVDLSPIPLIITRSKDGNILFANEPLANLVGIPASDLVGRRSPDFYCNASDREQILSLLRDHGEVRDHEVCFKRADGSTFWALLSLTAAEVNGSPAVIGAVNDIDRRKRMEDELRWERNFVSAVIDTAGALVVVLDRQGCVVRFNHACQETTGFTPDEVLGQPFWDLLLKPKDVEEVKAVFGQIRAGDFPLKHENCWRRKDGGSRLISWSNTALTDAGGEVSFIVGIGIDVTEQREAETKLKLYREIFMNAADSIVVIDRDGRIVERNPAHRRHTGLDDDRVYGRPAIELMDERFREVLAAVFREGQPFRGEVQIVPGDRPIDIDMSAFPIHNDVGELLAFASIGRDISERKRAEAMIATRLRYEEALAACSQALLSDELNDPLQEVLRQLRDASRVGRVHIFENFDDPVAGLCMRRICEVCTEEVGPPRDSLRQTPYAGRFDDWRRTLGRAEPLHGLVRELPSPQRELLAQQGIQSFLALPIFVDGAWYGFIGFDDIERPRLWSDEDIRTLRTAGEMVGVYLQRTRVEHALRVSEERFRSLVENADDVIYSLAPDGTFTYISPKFSDVTGYAVEDFLGKEAAELLHPSDRQVSADWLKEGIPQGKALRGFEYRAEHRDGSVRWFVSNSSVIEDDQGRVMEVVGIAHDITETKRVLEDLEQANREIKQTHTQLVQSEKMASLGMLVAGIAHEINTPIGAINSTHGTLVQATGKLKQILQAAAPELYDNERKLKRVLGVIDEANNVIDSGTERVTEIVRRLRSFARLDEAELKKVDLHEGLEDTLSILHHEIKHTIRIERRYGDLPLVPCYPGPLNQVFLNLLMNAKQAIAGEGTIEIRTAVTDGRLLIAITDDGQGMDAETQRHIFDPGFTTKGVGVGTGLGLSICYQILQDHRGEIQVSSSLGKGSTFTVVLPLNLDVLLGKDL